MKKIAIIVSSLLLAMGAYAADESKPSISGGSSKILKGLSGFAVDSVEIVSGLGGNTLDKAGEFAENPSGALVAFSKDPSGKVSGSVNWVLTSTGEVIEDADPGANSGMVSEGSSEVLKGSGAAVVLVLGASGAVLKVIVVDVSGDVLMTTSKNISAASEAGADGDLSESLKILSYKLWVDAFKAANPSGNYYEDMN